MPDRALLDELGRVAGDIGPVLAPAGGDELLSAITGTARRLFGAAACSLALLSDDESELVFTTAHGEGAAAVTGLRIASGTGIAGWVVMSGQPLIVSDLRRDPRWAGNLLPGTEYSPTSLLAAPVQTAQRMLGVIEVLDRREDRAGADADIELLGLFADQTAIAIEGARAFRDFGRELLSAAAKVTDGELSEALAAAARDVPPPDGDLLELAGLFAQLGRLDGDARRLAVRVLGEFVRHSTAQHTRRSPRRG